MKIDRELKRFGKYIKNVIDPSYLLEDMQNHHENSLNESFRLNRETLEMAERHAQEDKELHQKIVREMKEYNTYKVNTTERIATRQALKDAKNIALSVLLSEALMAAEDGDINKAQTILDLSGQVGKEIVNYALTGESDKLDPSDLINRFRGE